MYTFIVNPTAGSGRPETLMPRLTALLDERAIPWRIRMTEAAGQGSAIAVEAIKEGSEAVIVVGGDGTIGEVADGLKHTGIPLLIVSCGTGNDFVKSTSLPKNPLSALRAQLDAPLRRIDMGSVNGRSFLNVAGTGLDVEVLLCAEKYKQNSSGLTPYLRGVVDALRAYRPMEAKVSYDDEPLREARFTILSIGNGQYIGGGMRAVPDALLEDGLLDIIEARPLRKWQIGILMSLYIPGFHAKTALVQKRRVRKLRIVCKGMILNLDGELVPCEDAEFSVLPAALTVRLPAAK